jgi:hypothetical protein
MQRLDGEIWLTVDDLTDAGVNADTIYFGIKTNSPRWQAIPDPEDRRRRLVRYATLADKYQEQVKAALCGGLEPEEWLVMQAEQAKAADALGTRDSLLDKVEDICTDGYKKYLHLYRGVTTRQQRCLSRAAGIVDVAGRWYQAQGLPWRSYEPVNEIAAWVSAHLDEFFPLKYCPTNPTRLKEKIVAHWVDGQPLEAVITMPRSGNDNRATKKKETWWQAVAIHLKQTGRLQNDRAVYRKIRQVAAIDGKECPSESTIGNFLRETRSLTADRQYDLNNKGRQRHRSSMPLARPMFADDCWEMDGTRVQIAAHKTGDGQLKSLYIVAVRDVYSGAYLGYWYGYAESENAYRSALKMAVDITGRLPHELRYDQFPGSTSAGWKYLAGEKDKHGNTISVGELERQGVTLTKTSSAVGKAHAERAFYTLQQVFESEHRGYVGQGIKSGTMNARPTETYIARTWKKMLNEGWDFDTAWMDHAEIIAAYNHTLYSEYSKKYANLDQSPWQLYENGESSGRAVGMLEVSELFWNARREGIRNNRIEFIDRGTRYRYDIQAEDYELIYTYQKPNIKLIVRHDPWDFSTVMVFNEAGEFLAQIREQKDIQLMGKNPDWKAAAEWKQNAAAIEERKKAKLADYELPDEMALLLPTVASKARHNDAQKEYALSNAGSWATPSESGKGTKAQSGKVSPDVEIDPDAFARTQY